MDRCPCCNARLSGAAQCPRCQTDLSLAIGAEQSARFWLAEAIRHWEEKEAEQSMNALTLSLHLKKTKLAIIFRDYLIDRQCQAILELLAQKQLLSAKQRLYRLRLFIPHSKLLQQIDAFTDYLWVNSQGHGKSFLGSE